MSCSGCGIDHSAGLKYGVYQDYGQNKDFLQDLLMFYSLKEKKLITLKEYTEAMPEEQKYIYYATTVSADSRLSSCLRRKQSRTRATTYSASRRV